MRCPECEGRVVPIYYGHVDFAIIEKAIIGDLVIAQKFSIEKFQCKECAKKYIEVE